MRYDFLHFFKLKYKGTNIFAHYKNLVIDWIIMQNIAYFVWNIIKMMTIAQNKF